MTKSLLFITMLMLNLQLQAHPDSQIPCYSPTPLQKAYDTLTTFIIKKFDDNQINQLINYLEEPVSPRTYKTRECAMDIAAINFHPSQNLPRVNHRKKTVFQFLTELQHLNNG